MKLCLHGVVGIVSVVNPGIQAPGFVKRVKSAEVFNQIVYHFDILAQDFTAFRVVTAVTPTLIFLKGKVKLFYDKTFQCFLNSLAFKNSFISLQIQVLIWA